MSRSQKEARRAAPIRRAGDSISANEMPTGVTSMDVAANIAGDPPVWRDPPGPAVGGGVDYKPPRGPNATY